MRLVRLVCICAPDGVRVETAKQASLAWERGKGWKGARAKPSSWYALPVMPCASQRPGSAGDGVRGVLGDA